MIVAICCPLAGQVYAPAVDALIEFVADTTKYVESLGGTVIRLIGYRGQTAMSRYALGKAAVDAGADWLMWSDDDMVLPKDCFQRLYAHGKKMVSGAYFSRSAADPLGRGQYPLCAFKFVSDDLKPFEPPKFEPRGLQEVEVVGFGCLLMHVDVWNDVMKLCNGVPFRTEPNLTEDVWFEQFARKAGHSVWLDTTIVAGHLKLILISDKNREQIGGEPQS